jgi:5-methylcytosine-specific restriction endonuclease McrA
MKSIWEFRKLRAQTLPRSDHRIHVREKSRDPHIRDFLCKRQYGLCAGLLGRDGRVLKACLRRVGKKAHCDHIVELRYYGTDRRKNLQMLCKWCHRTKTGANAIRQTAW